MKHVWLKQKRSVFFMLLLGIVLIGILIAIPTGYEDALIYQGTERVRGEVIQVDNTAIKTSGLIQSGEQACVMKIKDGIFEGQELEGVNFLSGSLEKDKIYKVGDIAFVTISYTGRHSDFGSNVRSLSSG